MNDIQEQQSPEYGKDEVVHSYLELLIMQSLINDHLFGSNSSIEDAE